MKRTDLLCESAAMTENSDALPFHRKQSYGTNYTHITVSRSASELYSLRKGQYYTVFTENAPDNGLKLCIRDIISGMLKKGGVLAAGLGNESVCSDSLGVKTVRSIPATAHLSGHSDFDALGMRSVFVLEAGVTGKTGMESSEHISGIIRQTGVSCIVAVDSLACSELERLCTTIQITDTGIAPGSGVGNDRKPLNEEVCGVPVIAVGVPTVIDLNCISEGITGGEGLMVTPRNIDAVTARLARIIGAAISMALNPSLTEEEINLLRI